MRYLLIVALLGALASPLWAGPQNGFDPGTIYLWRHYLQSGGSKIDNVNQEWLYVAGNTGYHGENDGSQRSLCFSHGPAGETTVAGSRMFVAYNQWDRYPNLREVNAGGTEVRKSYPGFSFGNAGGSALGNDLVKLGSLRYNPAKDSLILIATVDSRTMAYEMELLDGTPAEDPYPTLLTDLVALQTYDCGPANRGQISIGDVDNCGNLYVTARDMDINGNGGRNLGDVLVLSTIGLDDGGTTYATPGDCLINNANAPYAIGVDPATGTLYIGSRKTNRPDQKVRQYDAATGALLNGDVCGGGKKWTNINADDDGDVFLVPEVGSNGGVRVVRAGGGVASIGGRGADAASPPSGPPAKVGELDILPSDDPNELTVNVQGKGRLPMDLIGNDCFDISTVDPATVNIAGVGSVKAPNLVGDVYELKVSRTELILGLGLDQMEPYSVVEITVEGMTLGGASFSATDTVTLSGDVKENVAHGITTFE